MAPPALAGFRSHGLTHTHLCVLLPLHTAGRGRGGGGGFSPHENGSLLREVHFHFSCWLYRATRHFVGGRRAFRTGERTHGLLSDSQGQVSTTVHHTGHKRETPQTPRSKTALSDGGFPRTALSPLLLSHQHGPPHTPAVSSLTFRGKAMWFWRLLAIGRKLRGEKPVFQYVGF